MEKIYIYCIAYGCPKVERSEGCPLLHIDTFTFEEKVNWIDRLEEVDREAILRYHFMCTELNN